MKRSIRAPWSRPGHSDPPEIEGGESLILDLADPWGQFVAIANRLGDRGIEVESPSGRHAGPALHRGEEIVCDDPVVLGRWLAPDHAADDGSIVDVREELLDPIYELGRIDDQRRYESAHDRLLLTFRRYDDRLAGARFLAGDDFGLADVLLFVTTVRLAPVYYELYKATVGRLSDFPNLEAYARDLFERPEFYETTDFEAIKAFHYANEPVLNAKGLVPRGGRPDLDAPHFRDERFASEAEGGVEEDQDKSTTKGEWVRGVSELRDRVVDDPDAKYPAEAGRYHLYAPYNCPWSHRALLGRAVKGLEGVVGASIVYFRRDPERGWQFNPAIPGCTPDLAEGGDYVVERYEAVGSDETSVPVLWDTETKTIVNNESADILRIFNDGFGDLAQREIDLYPAAFRDAIDRVNTAVYHRINNGAYKAGFAGSQRAYERAFARYFRALEWVEEILSTHLWLAGSPGPTEADLRLFPTVFRHDAVYYARFKLNAKRITDYPRLNDWFARMMDLPGVEEASNLDHSRNGYFGRTGNEIVPAGPIPLGLSRSDFSDEVWLAE